MSHSLKDPKRTWDAGMRDDDLVSIIMLEQEDGSPVDLKQVSPIHFVRVSDLRNAFSAEQVSITQPKWVEEGYEIRVVWVCAAAKQRSQVFAVEPNKVSLTPIQNGRRQTIQLSRSGGKITLLPQVKVGDLVEANQIVASVVPVYTDLKCPSPIDETYFTDKLASVNLTERYAAAKLSRL
ncbi:MAG: hypothetical protein GDA38_01360 [Hormoscilla sp. SP12CHS1]|nr:hypothetical protein [Hormoscilla sp. SP12CHS1]